jgi:hypothetical protein
VVENNKLEKRTEIELADRLRRCGEITETFPGQFMTPALKLLLTRLELNLNQRLLNLNNQRRAQGAHRRAEGLMAQGEDPVNNPPAPIHTEVKAKDVRFLLEALHGQVTAPPRKASCRPTRPSTGSRKSPHPGAAAHRVLQQPRPARLQQNQPGQARLAFERGVQYLRKQPEPRSIARNCNYWKVCWPAPTPPY